MRIIYGLDLGVASIGWAVVNVDESGKHNILGMGSRIIPYSDKEVGDEFGKGTGESVNQQRTLNRTARKGLDRYQLRRKYLQKLLIEKNMFPDETLMNLPALSLFELRHKAASEKVSLKELGRVWLHLNQRRGYKHGALDDNSDKKQRDWVAEINNRYSQIRGKKTIGQYFYEKLREHETAKKYYRIKEQIFPREAYIDEFNVIWNTQQRFYPELLTNELLESVRDEIIYYQRPLKSQKGLVSVCEFEGRFIEVETEGKTKEMFIGPKVAPRSSPLFQVAKLWESINNITVKRATHDGSKHEVFDISPFKESIFLHLDQNKNLSETQLFQILGVRKSDGYYADQIVRKKGIQGNLTRVAIEEALKGCERIESLTRFQFNLEKGNNLNRSTGEIMAIDQVSGNFEKEPLYRLWHTCYAIRDYDEKIKTLQKNFDLSLEYAQSLAAIDFSMGNFGNKSTRALRKILPALMKGLKYADAMASVGYDHSFSETKTDREQKKLLKELPLLQKNALRQPVVEKILNQMINLVNALMEEYGRPNEIRVELARELKQSKEERNEFFNTMNQRTKQNEKIAERLQKEYGVRATRKNIEKWRLWHEVNGRCLYCNQQITVDQFLRGIESDVEHIIPKALFFDDSFANKTIAHIGCNSTKNSSTAYDYMKGKGREALENYTKTIHELYRNEGAEKHKGIDNGVHCLTGKISKRKFERLQWRKEDIPQDFINRQLQESRYIARKAKQILNKVCREVYSTSGNITERLRHLWGWDDILMNLHLPKYREQGLTETIEIRSNGHVQCKEIIPGWSKRDDHRHHAIDALVVACTRQSFIQRINTLAATETKDAIYAEVKEHKFAERLTNLEKYLILHRPFTTTEVQEVVSNILVSFKAGKKVATLGKRKIKKGGKKIAIQEGIIVPRGALSEQSVYGKIKTPAKDIKKGELIRFPVKYLLENPHLIFKEKVRKLVEERLARHQGDSRAALTSLKKEPIYLDDARQVPLTFGTCFTEEAVIKYPLSSITAKDIPYVIDGRVRELIKERLAQHNNKEKEAFKEPLYYNESKRIPILKVRCFTGLNALEPVKKDESGREVGFVKPGNNHHIALYEDEQGNLVELPATFWHSVERKSFLIKHFSREERDRIQENTIIKNPQALWDRILELPEEILSHSFLEKLPLPDWKFVVSLQRNEMFVFGMRKEEINEAVQCNNYIGINNNLFRVQKLASTNYVFRHHLETKVDDKYGGTKNEMLSKTLGKLIIIQSLDRWKQLSPVKVRVGNTGKILKIG